MSDCEVCGRPLGDTWASECGPATQDDHWRLGYGRATLARVEAERERDRLRVFALDVADNCDCENHSDDARTALLGAEPGDAAATPRDGVEALRKLLAECAHAMEREAPYSRRKALVARIDAILERAAPLPAPKGEP